MSMESVNKKVFKLKIQGQVPLKLQVAIEVHMVVLMLASLSIVRSGQFLEPWIEISKH